MRDTMKLILQGGVIGIANIIPGVSGGTMAVVLGIYERLIEAISNFTNREKRLTYIIFLGKIALGAAIAIVALSWVMDFLLNSFPKLTYLFFIGLIAGSIPSIYKTHNNMRLTFTAGLAFLIGTALILTILIFFPVVERSTNISFEYQLNFSNLLLLFIGGIFAGGSMIVPGISGSFILVILGQYQIVIKAIKEFNLTLLAIVAIGTSIGIFGFAKLINICLKKFPKETFYFILGLVIASLISIYPGLPESISNKIIGIVLLLTGSVVAYLLGRK